MDRVLTPDGRILDQEFYRPVFSPWLGFGEFASYFRVAQGATLVSADRCWVLYSLCRQALFLEGDVWECGVYKGGTAAMLARIVRDRAPFKRLRLFDTFDGMPDGNETLDLHKRGDFADTSLASVQAFIGESDLIAYHAGMIPATFKGLEDSKIAFAHVDVDLWRSVVDCCEFIFPRLSTGGFLVFDDYGFATCPGARRAVDSYFADREAVPLVLPTGQAIVYKSR